MITFLAWVQCLIWNHGMHNSLWLIGNCCAQYIVKGFLIFFHASIFMIIDPIFREFPSVCWDLRFPSVSRDLWLNMPLVRFARLSPYSHLSQSTTFCAIFQNLLLRRYSVSRIRDFLSFELIRVYEMNWISFMVNIPNSEMGKVINFTMISSVACKFIIWSCCQGYWSFNRTGMHDSKIII